MLKLSDIDRDHVLCDNLTLPCQGTLYSGCFKEAD